jgi:transcriptional regulator with XRE-family HTH domain
LLLTSISDKHYLVCGNLFLESAPIAMSMGTFGEELRMERLNRGIALERITEVTKISQRHLVALEENQFRVLPGGILNKGIVRGYVNVLGLDEMDWVTRFQKEYAASGELLDDDRNWIEFAANVGRARVRPRDAATERLKWAGAILLLMVVGVAVFFAVRYYGFRSGWWPTVVPGREVASRVGSLLNSRPGSLAGFMRSLC